MKIFGVSLSDNQFGSDSTSSAIGIDGLESDSLINPAHTKQADSK